MNEFVSRQGKKMYTKLKKKVLQTEKERMVLMDQCELKEGEERGFSL